jgi:hypothetical protein
MRPGRDRRRKGRIDVTSGAAADFGLCIDAAARPLAQLDEDESAVVAVRSVAALVAPARRYGCAEMIRRLFDFFRDDVMEATNRRQGVPLHQS